MADTLEYTVAITHDDEAITYDINTYQGTPQSQECLEYRHMMWWRD